MPRNAALVPIFLLPLSLGCPKRIQFGPEGEIHDAQTLLERVDAADGATRSVKGEARLKVRSLQTNGTVTLFVAAAKPAQVHLEPLDFFGKPQAALVSNGTAFALFDQKENTFYRGPATAPNVSRLLPIVLEPAELVSILLGSAPRESAEHASVRVDPGALAYEVALGEGSAAQRLWIEPKVFRVTRSERHGADGYTLAFADFEQAGQVPFPMRVSLEAPRSVLELVYKDVQVNGVLEPDLFELAPPAGARVVNLNAQGEQL